MDNNTYVLRIEVSGVDDSGGDSGKESGGTVSPGVANNKNMKAFARGIAKFSSVTHLIRQIASNPISEISAYSGNSRYQARVEAGVAIAGEALSTVVSFVIHPVVGFAHLAVKAIDTGFEMRGNNFNRELEKMQIAQLQQRANLYNRSR